MSVKIQINSLDALERLIGGDTEMEIDIRGTIVQEFAKKHLKGVADEAFIKNEADAIKEFVRTNMFSKVGYNTTLAPGITDSIRKKFNELIETEISSLAVKSKNEIYSKLEAEFEKKLQSAIAAIEDRYNQKALETYAVKKLDDYLNKIYLQVKESKVDN